MLSARDENINTLMSVLGLSDDAAVTLLAHRVLITHSPEGDLPDLAADITRVLQRTLNIVGEVEDCDLELAVGKRPTHLPALHLSFSDESLLIRPWTENLGDGKSPRAHIAKITQRACACFAAGAVVAHWAGNSLPATPPSIFEMRFSNIGLPVEEITHSLDLKDSVLAGGGGVASGFLWGLETLQPRGKLTIVDPKKARAGNSNRCLFFVLEDDGYKAEILADRVKLPGVQIVPFVGTVSEYVKSRADKRLPQLISTADSRPVRRSFQNELPRIVFDASTTDVTEVIIHSHEQPTENACLSCIYHHVADEDFRDKHIAETLGLTLQEVQVRFINGATAQKLKINFPQLDEQQLVGVAFDTLHKKLCGEQALRSPAAQQAAAPFAFISNLAGVLLALEMYRHQTSPESWRTSNYMALSPWIPPHRHVRRLHPRYAACDFCSNPTSREAMKSVWSDVDVCFGKPLSPNRKSNI